MPRAPCCDHNLGLNKGPWTRQEDLILIVYVKNHGHPNWRALPKQAGLLRCGKSCRLRWNNYLRPDIKRGNFSPEEEDDIIRLHQMLGNRWSAIAAKLPGRTDNEIKNVWHTHLKKRSLNNNHIQQQRMTSNDKYESDAAQRSVSGSESSSPVPESMEMLETFPAIDDGFNMESNGGDELLIDDAMDFWYNILLQAEDNLSLLQ